MALIVLKIALPMSGPAGKDILRSERHRRRLAVAEAMAKMMMVQDDGGGEGRGKTGRTILVVLVLMGGQVEGRGGMPRPGLDTRAKSMRLWRLRVPTPTSSKRPSTPFSKENIPNPLRKRHLPPIPA